MPVRLEEVVPWGRSMAEYRAMFELCAADEQGSILGCADGPASFNAEMHARGHAVISVDPIYRFSAAEISAQIAVTSPKVEAQLRENPDDFVWRHVKSPEALVQRRMTAMRTFLADFEIGLVEGRYRVGELPMLPFASQVFDLALCSHYLFLYSEHVTVEQHEQAIVELCRVAREVRLFPVIGLDGAISPHIDTVRRRIHELGRTAELRRVDYEFQRGGDHMLVIR